MAEDFLALHAQMAGGLGGGRSAIDIQHVVQTAVGKQLGVEHALIAALAGSFITLQHHRARAVAEQDAGTTVGPVQEAAHAFRADQEHRIGLAAPDEIVRHRQAIDEAGTNRLNVEGSAVGHPQPGLHARGGGGKGFVGCGGAADDDVDFARVHARVGQSLARRRQRQVRSLLAIAHHAALADAGALADPGIRGIHDLGQIVVGDDFLRQIGTTTDDAGTDHAPTVPTRARSAVMRVLMSALAMVMAMSSAEAKPMASVPPWLFTTTPPRPRKMPPLAARGSSRRRSVLSAPEAIKAPIWPRRERFKERRRNWPTSLAVPSAVLRAILPVKPSVTTTSTVPSAMSLPSMKPWNAMGNPSLVAARSISAAPFTASLPFCSSVPTFKSPTLGRSRPRIACAKASPITAKSTNCSAVAETLAPQSKTTVWPRSVGQIEAMAGREMPSITPNWNMLIAIKAPVLPAETATSASLFFTTSSARHMLVSRPRRSTWLGLSSIATRSGAWRTPTRVLSLGWRARSPFKTASSPARMKFTSGWRCTTRINAVMTMPGPASPPIASTETVNSRATAILP